MPDVFLPCLNKGDDDDDDDDAIAYIDGHVWVVYCLFLVLVLILEG